MNSTNNFFEIAAKKVFSDLYDLVIEDEKPYKFDLSKMPDDVTSCIGKQLVDCPFKCYEDTELFKMFFKHDKADDYKEYIQYLTDIKNNKTHKKI